MASWGRGTRGTRARALGGESGRGNSWRGGRGRGQKPHTAARGVCRYFQQTGFCKFGANCKFSHEPGSETDGERLPRERPARAEETLEQRRAKADYNSWRRIIKVPPQPNYEGTVGRLWNDALEIMNGDEQEWKQMVPRDLDDEGYFGRQHMLTLLELRTRAGDYAKFIRLVRPFLQVIKIGRAHV